MTIFWTNYPDERRPAMPVYVSWIRIETKHGCGHSDLRERGSICCGRTAEWEEVRATDGTDPIAVGKPRIRCDAHVPADTDEVKHVREEW